MNKSDYFTSDILEFIRLMDQYVVAYVIIGGEAVIYYGYPRLTGDIDLFYEHSDTNANALFKALLDFWEGDIPGIHDKVELTEPSYIIQSVAIKT